MKDVKPILPINIKIIMTHFPTPDNSGVKPSDKPVVPKAEHTSNKILMSGASSVIHRITVAMKHKQKAVFFDRIIFSLSFCHLNRLL